MIHQHRQPKERSHLQGYRKEGSKSESPGAKLPLAIGHVKKCHQFDHASLRGCAAAAVPKVLKGWKVESHELIETAK